MNDVNIIFCVVLISASITFQQTSIAQSTEVKLNVYAVNYPLEYFAQRIGGVQEKVNFPIPETENPATRTPTSDVIREYQKTDIILLNGAGYAKWIEMATLPASKLVNTSSEFKDRDITVENAVSHSHGNQERH